MDRRQADPAARAGEYLDEMVQKLLELDREERTVLAALDGRCAAGKTTLANALGAKYGWQVIHMDHFFLRPEQRTARRLSVPGENVDHERFLEEVLRPLRAGKAACYRPFDCHTQSFGAEIRAEPGTVTIVEGAYACHPCLWDLYDLRAFLTVEPALQRARILARSGPEGLRVFERRWIPLEEAYLAAFHVEERCRFRLEAGALEALP